MRTALAWLLTATTIALAIACFLAPLAIALASLGSDLTSTDVQRPTSPRASGLWLSPRQWGLLGRSAAVAAGAAFVAVGLGAALAAGLVCEGAPRRRALVRFLCIVTLLTPPYIYAYAWSLPLLPAGIIVAPVLEHAGFAFVATTGRAIWCLGSWLAPLAAFLLAAGWRVAGRPAYRLAVLDARPLRAVGAALPAMLPYVAIAGVATGALALNEYTVCHLCLVQTWNTEILAEIQSGQGLGRVLVFAWPLLAVVAVVLGAGWMARERLLRLMERAPEVESDGGVSSSDAEARRYGRAECPRHPRVGWRGWVGPVAGVVLAVPVLIFVAWMGDWSALFDAWRTYPREWPDGLRQALLSAVAAVVLGFGVAQLVCVPRLLLGGWQRLGRGVGAGIVLLAVLFAMSPPALVGDAFVTWLMHLTPLRDSVAAVSMVAAARFAVIPMLAAVVAARAIPEELSAASAADGASHTDYAISVQAPLILPTVLAAGAAAGLLALTEVSATQLVTPPAVRSLALTMLNAIHFGRDDKVIALSLQVVLLVGVAAAVWMFAARRRMAKHE